MEDIENRRKKEVEGSDEVKENNQNESEEDLKNIIARHPLFEVLIESHMKCLEVGYEEAGEFDITSDAWKKLVNTNSKATTSPNTSELDHFMEAYCMALSKLKEAIEEPTKEAKAFINATYIQLKELGDANNPQINCDNN
ncbi:homeobox protein knotted-1-like 6 [Cicer arietinum]|uniref:Homeobox protein rough sheath 1-like n=1 Tax=Cicer arietinum TaxID=3827 RepID=A0A1S2Y580_CICAR|nr:homeobox protein rough sheath 1-like [Cicer arietinum]